MITASDRYVLSPLTAGDDSLMLDLWQNTLVRQHLGGIVPLSQIKVRFEAMLSADEHSLFYTIKARDTETAMGLISISDYHDTGQAVLPIIARLLGSKYCLCMPSILFGLCPAQAKA